MFSMLCNGSSLRVRVSSSVFLQNTMTQSMTATRFREALIVVVCLLLGGATATSSECSVKTADGSLNFGINEGGCFVCTSSATGEQASGKELEDLCRQACLADSQCKAFETSHEDINAYYATIHPTGQSINCCIEHKAPTNFQNPVSAATATGFCQKEFKCWNSHILTGTCPPMGARPAQCVYDTTGWGVHNHPTEVQSVINYVASGCEQDISARLLLNDAKCTSKAGRNSISLLLVVASSIISFTLILE